MADYNENKQIQGLDTGSVNDNSEFIFTNGDKALKAKRSALGLVLESTLGNYYTKTESDNRYLQSFTESDPIFSAWLDTDPFADFVTGTPWRDEGYLTSFDELDPEFNAWLETNPLNGFLTEETDPEFNAWFDTDPLSGFLTSDNIITVPGVQFDTTATPATNAEGLLQWNEADGTLDLGMSGGDVTMQLGQELFMKVRNVSGTLIANGSPVYISGRTGNRPNIYLAKSDSDTTADVIGITTQDIDSPADGFVTTLGYVRGIKTDYTGTGAWGTTWASGDRLYISKTVAGQLTNVEPAVSHHSDIVGTVGVVHQNLGSILVNIQKHKTLEELTDVDGTPLATDGQFPVWNQTAGYFDFNKNINELSVSKTISYNPDGTVNVVTTASGTKTMGYTGGVLTSIAGTGIYKNKTLTYTGGVLTAITVS
jgi:hypothetical protein